MPYPPLQAAQLSHLSTSGIKQYAKRYAAFFSPSANPSGGRPRSFTAEDVARLRLIGALAKSGMPADEIMARLQDGEMGEMPDDASQNAIEAPQATQPQQAAIMLAQSAVSALTATLEAERTERQALAQRLQDAEIRAAVAEAQLEAARRPWWKRLFGN